MALAGIDFSVNMFRWCIDELRYKAGIYQRTGAITVFDGDVVKSDKVVPENIRDALKRAARCLEDVPEVSDGGKPVDYLVSDMFDMTCLIFLIANTVHEWQFPKVMYHAYSMVFLFSLQTIDHVHLEAC